MHIRYRKKKELIVIATHHKTGHHIMDNIFRDFAKPAGLHYYDVSKSSFIPHDADVIVYEGKGLEEIKDKYEMEGYRSKFDFRKYNIKGIHVIRNPFEIIVSAYKFHKTENRPRLDVKHKEWGNKSYRECLHMDNGLIFEMEQQSRRVINAIYSWDYSDKRFLNIKLEDFYDDFDKTIIKIANHLGFNSEIMLFQAKKYDIQQNIPNYATNKTGNKYTYPNFFKKEHYEHFFTLFPSDIFNKLGYLDVDPNPDKFNKK